MSARRFRRPSARSAAFVLAAGLLVTPVLAACGGPSSKASASGSASGSSTSSGVKVTGAFGQKPALTVPGGAAPTKLNSEVLSQGNGPAVASGQTIVVNYLGQTWEPKDGKPNVFDNSFDRKQPVNFPIGKGQVIAGWDKTLVGQKAGSRVLLTIPPSEGYGNDASSALAKNTLLFVVDVLGSYDAAATASGSPAAAVPAGFPAVTTESGKVPAVTSVKGVSPGKDAKSALLLKGSGAADRREQVPGTEPPAGRREDGQDRPLHVRRRGPAAGRGQGRALGRPLAQGRDGRQPRRGRQPGAGQGRQGPRDRRRAGRPRRVLTPAPAGPRRRRWDCHPRSSGPCRLPRVEAGGCSTAPTRT